MKQDYVIKDSTLIHVEKWDKLRVCKQYNWGVKFWGLNFAIFYKENIFPE